MTVDMLASGLPASASLSAEAAWSASARHQWIAGAALTGQHACGAESGYASGDLGPFLELRTEQLRVRSVRNTEPHLHRLQLAIHEEPCAAAALDCWQRREQRVNRLSRGR